MQLKSINIFKYLSASLIAAILLVATNISIAADTHSANEVSGHVTATSADGSVKRLKSGDEVEDGDVINTGTESNVSITLANGEIVAVGPLSTYIVGESAKGTGGAFANISSNTKSPSLSTATSAGGGIDNQDAPTTPPTGGSPTN